MSVLSLPQAVQSLALASVEKKLLLMKAIKEQQKPLDAEYKMLKEQVIKDYFNQHSVYQTSKGLILAEYIMVEANRFQTKKFEADHPDLFKQYSEKNVEFRFLPK